MVLPAVQQANVGDPAGISNALDLSTDLIVLFSFRVFGAYAAFPMGGEYEQQLHDSLGMVFPFGVLEMASWSEAGVLDQRL